MEVFIVKTQMASPFYIDETKEIDSRREERTFHYEKDIRQKIGAVRARNRKPIYAKTVNFHGLYLCNTDTLKEIETAVAQADKEFKEIDPDLEAKVKFLKLDMGALTEDKSKNGLYAGINTAIKKRVFGDVFKRLDKILANKQDLPDKSRQAILNMVKHLRAINILQDEGVAGEIDRIEKIIMGQLEKTSVTDLRKELENELKRIDITSGRFAAVEL